MRSICVFCGSNAGARPEYLGAAMNLGNTLAERSIELVYGGASVGLMGAVANAVLSKGGHVFGVLPVALSKKEIAHPGLTELHIVSSMHERKELMAARADAFIALPGGFGTLDELFEILTWAQLGLHQKPCCLLNIEGFFDGLLAFLEHIAEERLLRPEHRAMLLVETDAARLVERLQTYRPPIVQKWITRAET